MIHAHARFSGPTTVKVGPESMLALQWHRELPPTVAEAWDQAWQELDLHPYQHRQLAQVRARIFNHQLLFLTGHADEKLIFGAAVQVRGWSPLMPHLAANRGPWARDAETLVQGLKQIGAGVNPLGIRPMAVRLDPHWLYPAAESVMTGLPAAFQRGTEEMHDQSLLVALQRPDDEIFASCRRRTRQALRKAEQTGIHSRLGTAEDIARYWELHCFAAQRKGYGIPEARWLHALLASGQAQLIMTEDQGKLVGGAWYLIGSKTAHYLYGASDPDYDGPALYHTTWFLFRWGRAQGLEFADLGGILEEENGVSFFKRSFGGDEIRAMPELEVVYRSLAWSLWHKARPLFRH